LLAYNNIPFDVEFNKDGLLLFGRVMQPSLLGCIQNLVAVDKFTP
jgi:hypothetical protein